MVAHREAAIALDNGMIFKGAGFGASGEASGEVVFNTSSAGYTEALSDPSYNGQIPALGGPLVGNYGVPSFDARDEWGLPIFFESESFKPEGLIVWECCKQPYHYTMVKTLDQWLRDENKPGIEGIDVRQLTKILRSYGVMLGIVKVAGEGEHIDYDDLKKRGMEVPDPNVTRQLVKELSVKEAKRYDASAHPDKHKTVALVDCGVKYNIIRCLLKRGINVVVMPWDTTWEQVQDLKPGGMVFSPGPGNPKDCKAAIKTVASCIDNGLPTMGICLGNQIMALAVGADTYKMKYGHRAANKPVIDLTDPVKHAFITTQNHGFAIDKDTLPPDIEVYFINADDKTVEGIRHKTKPAFAVQFHPEATPGPYDTEYLFDKFVAMLG
ncbi:MAG: glutamine-hydrolyzing carbamoyl-phosphate synthase small subunit [Candidatus Lokiarchaeota archaeon]|nr:glutamine-hydrolyzing carbamoyl-phosphate synthase small subunit [Candidatus Lokiarchaeota archaeon]